MTDSERAEAPTVSDPHAVEEAALLDALDSDEDGLSSDEAARRLETYGRNEFERGERVDPLAIFVDQFRDFLIYLLFGAAFVSVAIGLLPGREPEYVDAALIVLILLGNGVFGFVQDYRAEKSIEELRKLSSPDAVVRRDGEKVTIDSTEVVPGDVVYLEQGDAVPADVRLLSTSGLETDESALTGESVPVAKDPGVVEQRAPVAERPNMAYMNTTVSRGRGVGVVVETGMGTQAGGIARQLAEAEDGPTPFQAEMNDLGRQIGYGVVAIIAVVAVVQFAFTGATLFTTFLVAVSLAVAAVPEGLPAVVTLTLALGSKKLLSKNALVRRLPVVESLGSVDVIVTDKTGTLTEESMTVRRLWFGGETFSVTGTGLKTTGEFKRGGDPVDPAVLSPLLRCGRLCNNAERAPESEDRAYYGDPTEVALLVSAAKAGVENDTERVNEFPFSSERKRMTVVTDDGHAYMKGAPETVLDRCDRVLQDGEPVELTPERRRAVLEGNAAFAGDALRVLGFATKRVEDPDAPENEVESGMTFLGLQGMIDPPRESVPEAVGDCRAAGIDVVMATGDNLATAKAIGAEIGFDPAGAKTGADLDGLSDADLREVVEDTEIFARVSPAHKVRVLDALQANGHRVAMTGDGVNDAPALKNADVGISMGIRGTDVAKGSSDMVLQDDNFVTIRDAIAEGRGIFDNIRKFVTYLLSYNAGEVMLVFLGTLVGGFLFPETFSTGERVLVLTPVMLLWINLVTDGLPALALGADPKAEGVMARPPRGRDERVIDRGMVTMILGIGALMTATALPLFFLNIESMVRAQTVVFTTLVVFELFGVQAIRRRFDVPLFSNRWLWLAVAGSLLLQLGVLYTPVNQYFRVVPLSASAWGQIGASLVAFVVALAAFVLVLEWVTASRERDAG